MLNESKIFSVTSKIALAAPALFTILERGLTPEAGKEIVRKYSGYDGQPVRSVGDLTRIAGNLIEGYGVWGAQKVVTTGIRKGTALLNRALSGRF